MREMEQYMGVEAMRLDSGPDPDDGDHKGDVGRGGAVPEGNEASQTSGEGQS